MEPSGYILLVVFSGPQEAYKAFLRIQASASGETLPDHLSEAGIDPFLQDNSIVFPLPTEALALSALSFFEKSFGRERLRLIHSDGWECCESELLGNSYIEDRYLELFGADDKNPAIPSPVHKTSSRHLILASRSPRRREYLKLAGIPFTCETVDKDEQKLLEEANCRMTDESFGVRAACTVMYLAEQKAAALLPTHRRSTILGSDTLVTIDGTYLGKPESPEEALSMLRRLAGRDHHVWTGVSIVEEGRRRTFYSSTRVRFLPWSDEIQRLAESYVASGSPMDKAGAYGIQDMGALLIREIRGDFYTVVGLPVSAAAQHLREFGF
jgi:septum formation protein